MIHGARAPQVAAAAERRLEAAAALEAVVTFGLPRDVDPTDALLEEVHRTAGHVAYLQSKIASLPEAELKQTDMSGRFERPSVWVELYQSERTHLARVAKAAIDAGVAERQVRLAEEQGRLWADTMKAILDTVFGELTQELAAAGVSVEVLVRMRRDRVPDIIRSHLIPLAEGEVVDGRSALGAQ